MRRTRVSPAHYAPVAGSRSYVIAKDPVTGKPRIEVDPAKRFIYPYTLVSEPEKIFVPRAEEMCPSVDAGGLVTEAVIFPIDNKGPFEVVYTEFRAIFLTGPNAGQPTDDFTVAIFDPEMRPVLMNREIHASTIAGGFGSSPTGDGILPAAASAAGRPFVWPETFFMDPYAGGKALFMAYRNLTTEDIEVRWAFHGVRYYHPEPYESALAEKEKMVGPGRVSTPYFYTTDTNILLPGGDSFDFQIRITDEADVEIFKMTAKADFPFLWRIMERAGTRFLDNAGPSAAGGPNGIHSAMGFGNGEFPFILYETLYWEQNFKVLLRLVNSLTDQQNRIWPTFACRKITHARQP